MKNFSNPQAIPMSRSRGSAQSQNSTAASQNMVAMLEARISQLENILGLDSSGDLTIDANNINIRGSKVSIESNGKLTLKSSTDLKLDSLSIDVKATSAFNLNATTAQLNASTLNLSASGYGKFNAGGSLELTGSVASLSGASITKLGKGLLPVATASTSITAAGFTLSTTVVSPGVLA